MSIQKLPAKGSFIHFSAPAGRMFRFMLGKSHRKKSGNQI